MIAASSFTPEEARFHLMLIQLGICDRFSPWLDALLEKETPLSDPVLELSWCSSDMKQVIHVLEDYLRNQETDMHAVIRLLCADLRLRMDAGELDTNGCMKLLKQVCLLDCGIGQEPWSSIDNLLDWYDISQYKDFRINGPGFEEYLLHFFDEGTSVPSPFQADIEYSTAWKKIARFLNKLFNRKV